MSEAIIYVEGGGDSKALHIRCREGFRKLLEKSGFARRLPRIVACGSRNATFDDFKTAHTLGNRIYVALLVDSEDPVSDIEQTWGHLKARDNWDCPRGAADDQVFLMTTCMETWIIADRSALDRHFGDKLQKSALPPILHLEQRDRHEVQDKLMNATRECSNPYAKNKRSFEALANVDPNTLRQHLSSFARMLRILNEKL